MKYSCYKIYFKELQEVESFDCGPGQVSPGGFSKGYYLEINLEKKWLVLRPGTKILRSSYGGRKWVAFIFEDETECGMGEESIADIQEVEKEISELVPLRRNDLIAVRFVVSDKRYVADPDLMRSNPVLANVLGERHYLTTQKRAKRTAKTVVYWIIVKKKKIGNFLWALKNSKLVAPGRFNIQWHHCPTNEEALFCKPI